VPLARPRADAAVEHVLRGFGEPRYTAAHPDGRHAYVTDAKRGEVVALDVIRGPSCAAARVGRARAAHHDRPAWPHALGRLGRRRRRSRWWTFETARPRLVRRFAPPFLAHDVGWAPGGNRVWVSSGDRNELALYAARSGRLLRRLGADGRRSTSPSAASSSTSRAARAAPCACTASAEQQLRKTAIPDDSYNVQQAHGWVVTPGSGTGTLCALDRTAASGGSGRSRAPRTTRASSRFRDSRRPCAFLG
jgi:hypothetical protein